MFSRVSVIILVLILTDVTRCAELLRGSSEVAGVTEGGDSDTEKNRDLQIIKVGLMDMNVITLFDLNKCNILQSRPDLLSNNVFKKREYKILKVADVRFSEKFAGQSLKGQQSGEIGFRDQLKGKPNKPLKLAPNTVDRENVYAKRSCMSNGKGGKTCGVEVMGRTISGFKGVGSVAAIMKRGMSRVTIHLKTVVGQTTQMGTNGAIDGKLVFYKGNGKKLGSIDVNVRDTKVYTFSRFQGDIKGFTLEPRGEKMNWHQLAIHGLCYE